MRLGTPELLIILVVVLLLFGATRLPKLAHSMGEAIKQFRSGISGEENQSKKDASDTPKKTDTPQGS